MYIDADVQVIISIHETTLNTIGVKNIQDFFGVSDAEVAELFSYKESTVQKWRKELLGWVVVDKKEGKRK